ncbi:MAG: type IV secretion system DNA-binding domain-containing protein [Patescibacteria group bacterium]|nr:type IV secretion system DNA-binding domain-containing protein [Patescibacteria group bacterium]
MSNELTNNDITPIGVYNFRNQRKKFGIKVDDRRRHVYVIGKTGVGKTTLLENMVISDIQSGKGVAVIDPHGEFAEKMLDFVPEERLEDVIYFDPADMENPIAFNPMEQVGVEARHLLASSLMGVFKKIWADAWSARMQYILNNTLLALLEYPGATLLGIMQMFSNKAYRKKIVDNLQDVVVRSFWQDEFAAYSQKFETEALAAIQNKVGQFVSNPLVRNILGQPRSTLNMREIMDKGKIFIANLSKGKVGEDNSALLGAMIITRLQLAAMSRVDIPEDQRRDFFLYVDEFQNFATDSFANILSEARKYRLSLILAHQYIGQLVAADNNTKVRDAVFGNVGTIVSFRVGAADAEFLEKEFMPEFLQNDLVNLAKANIYIKLMIDGVASRPFSAETLPPQKLPLVTYRDVIVKNSRDRYGTPKAIVEERINAEIHSEGAVDGVEEKMGRRGERPLAEVLGGGAGNRGQGTGNRPAGRSFNEGRGPRTMAGFSPRNERRDLNFGTTNSGQDVRRQAEAGDMMQKPDVMKEFAPSPRAPEADKPKPLTPLEAAAGVQNPPQPKKFPKANVDIEALRKAIHDSLKKKGDDDNGN